MERTTFLQRIEYACEVNHVVAILGPRQCGKTTLARAYIKAQKDFNPQNYFDLENPNDLARLLQPHLMLSQLEGLIVIDEIQRLPDLFPILRVLVDNKKHRFLILGSASRELIKQSSETLAGRISYLELTPFSYAEVKNLPNLWLRGGFPNSYLAKNEEISWQWREGYIQTFLEADIPNLGIKVPPMQLRRFWMMLAHYHGNLFNASEIGRSLSLNYKTIQNYLDILSGTFMMRQLPPWFENISKRQIKTQKIYFRDTGIFHSLLGIPDKQSLLLNPKLGASWEGFALEEIIRYYQIDAHNCYFWATHGEAELDLLIIQKGKRLGFEFKYTDTPKVTKSMRIAIESLKLDALTVIYPGKYAFPLTDNIKAIGLEEFLSQGEI